LQLRAENFSRRELVVVHAQPRQVRSAVSLPGVSQRVRAAAGFSVGWGGWGVLFGGFLMGVVNPLCAFARPVQMRCFDDPSTSSRPTAGSRVADSRAQSSCRRRSEFLYRAKTCLGPADRLSYLSSVASIVCRSCRVIATTSNCPCGIPNPKVSQTIRQNT